MNSKTQARGKNSHPFENVEHFFLSIDTSGMVEYRTLRPKYSTTLHTFQHVKINQDCPNYFKIHWT